MNHVPCSLFGVCGGCDYQHLDYAEELQIKNKFIASQFSRLDFFHPQQLGPIVASPKDYHYRHRLDLKVVRTKDNRVLMGFTPRKTPERQYGLIEADGCPIAMEAVSGFLPQLKDHITQHLSEKYRRGNLVVRTGDDGRVAWGGIGKRSLDMKEENYFSTAIHDKRVFYSLDGFFQANLSILPRLFEKIYALDCWGENTVFYDLYGGVGLFGIGLSDHAGKIYLIEESESSLKAARYNVTHHQFQHFEIIAGKVEHHFPELLNRSDARGKKHVVMIDPPRSGLTPDGIHLLNGAIDKLDVVLYLSCNPKALIENLKGLHKGGWTIERIIPFDFFPKTAHVETLVVMKP